jgi:hypothetical protein
MPSSVAQDVVGGRSADRRRDASHTAATGRGFDPRPPPCHPFRVTRWENEDAVSAPLVARLHVDLQRVASAVCPRG